MASFFAGSSNVTILGGDFNDVKGNLTLVDKSQHTTNLSSNNKYTNNVVNAHNDNSTKISGSVVSEEMLSMHSRSPGYRQEDHTQAGPPPPQRPRLSHPQISSTGGSVTNLDSFNVENTHVNGAFNNNSQNYYQGGVPPDNRRQHNGPNWMSGPDQSTIPSTSGPHGSGQFKAPVQLVQVPFQAIFPQQMGVGGPPGPRTSVKGANIQQLDQDRGRDFEKWLKFTISQAQSKVVGNSGGNYDPQAPYSPSSRNAEGNESMNTGMAKLSLNDSQIPTHLSPPTFSTTKSDPQIGPKLTDQMGSSNLNPSTSNLRYNVVQQDSHSNPSLPVAPHANEPGMVNFLSQPTETPPYGNNPNRPPPPASTSPFNFPPSSIGGPNFNSYYGDLTKHDHRVHHTNIDSFNEHNNTLRDSFNDNSFVSTGNRSASESNKKRGFPDADVPIETRKKRDSGVRTTPNPDRIDEDPSSDESTADSSGKKKKAKKWTWRK